MNTFFLRHSRRAATAFLLLSSLSVAVPAQARPADPNWRPILAANPSQDCGPVFDPQTYGPRAARRIVGPGKPCAKPLSDKTPIRWTGPRGTIPLYQ